MMDTHTSIVSSSHIYTWDNQEEEEDENLNQSFLNTKRNNGPKAVQHIYASTCWLVYFSNGLCPRLHISYNTTPKLHTSLALE